MAIKWTGLSIEDLTHPGEHLKEILQAQEMTQKELAIRLGVSEKHISSVIAGKNQISSDMAFGLSKIFPLPASFWNGLQAKYNEERTAIERENNITEYENQHYSSDIYKVLADRKYVPKIEGSTIDSKKQRISGLRNFLGVAALDSLISLSPYFYRKDACTSDPLAMACWHRICEIEREKIKITKPFNTKALTAALPTIRSLNLLDDPNSIISQLQNIFADCGVAFCVVVNIKGAPVQGFSGKHKGVAFLCMTIRRGFADIFWFTLFHEISHLLSYAGTNYLSYTGVDHTEQEKEADTFASNILLQDNKFKDFYASPNKINPAKIREFAKSEGLHPGIIVGRLQHNKIIKHNQFNELRVQYRWAKHSE